MSLIFDEHGRPFILLRDQESKKRTKGIEAHRVSFLFNENIGRQIILFIIFNFRQIFWLVSLWVEL